MALSDIGVSRSTVKLSSITPADGKLVPFVTTQAGSAVITSSTAIFASDDVGKRIRVAGAANAGADLFTTIVSFQSEKQVTLAVNATTVTNSRGAILGTDCGAGLQAALDTIYATNGGTILVDGLFYWETPVLRNFGTTVGISLSLVGAGWGTGMLVAGDASKDMLTIQNCPKLVVQEMNFAGCPMAANDCRRLLNLEGSEYILERNGFFGISVAGPDLAGVAYARGCRSRHFDNEFGGCIASSGIGTNVVDLDNFQFIDIERDRFVDYGRFQGALLSKTGLGFCFSWIRIRNPQNASAAVNTGSVVRVTDCNFDEGHFVALLVSPLLERRIPQARITGCRFNNTLLDGGVALGLERIDNVIVEQLSIGWANTPHNGTFLTDCGNVLIDGAYITDGAPVSPYTGMADGLSATSVRSLVLKNAQAFRRRFFKTMGSVQEIIDGVGGVTPFFKRGRITDADFVRRFGIAPPACTVGYDEANKKIYVKDRELGWIATGVLAANGDATFALANGTPATGTLTGADTYAKTSGANGWNTTALLTDVFTGGFRMAARILAGSDVVLGAQNPTFPIPAGPNDFFVRALLGGGNLYWGSDATNWNSYAYTLGDLIEIIYDPSATGAEMKLRIAGADKATHAAPAGLKPSTQHRFSSSLWNGGAKFQLVDYSNL